MAVEEVGADVVPAAPQRAGQTAKALQRRGFRVLHVGGFISVVASRRDWESTFGVSFTTATKTVQQEVDRDAQTPSPWACPPSSESSSPTWRWPSPRAVLTPELY